MRQANRTDEVLDTDGHEHENVRPASTTREAADDQTPLVVLSRDEALVQTVRRAAPAGMPVVHAASLDEIADTLPRTKPGVLLAATADTPDYAAMLAQLTQHFPELVCIVAGKVSEKNALMQLTAAGGVFRFLLTPLTHGQTQLALQAARARHLELKASADRLGSNSSALGGGSRYIAAYAKLAIGALVVIGAIWWGVDRLTQDAPPAAQATPTPSDALLVAKPDPVEAELRLAKEAFDQGNYLEPAGESALDLYRSALAMAPNSDEARAGIRAVADKILERAESALTNSDLETAVRNIESARAIDATHPRLAFLDVQIAREHERLKLSRAQDITERVGTLVAQAYRHMQAGNLTTPASASARDSLLAARRLDPTDPTVTQGMRDLSANLAEAAQRALAAGQLTTAQQHVDAARSLGASSASLASVERSIRAASQRERASPPPATLAADAQNASAALPIQTNPAPIQTPSNATSQGSSVPPDLPAQSEPPARSVVQAAELRRTRQVAPTYPQRAAMSGIEGWVDIEFTITPEGVPTDLEVLDAKPRNTFNQAALRALSQWRFEPPSDAQAQRAVIRLRFELEN